jgi:glutamate--cysteine ligase
MLEKNSTLDEPIVGIKDLIDYLVAGCKPSSAWRIGTEHEKFAYRADDLRPLTYEGQGGIRDVLERLCAFGWQPVLEGGNVIALQDDAGCSITLEPGGQVELSGAPLNTIHQTCGEIDGHLEQVKHVGDELGFRLLGLGYQPKWPIADLPWMPKERYRIMRRYMPTRGRLGMNMMQATCTVQVNLDFDSERTMVDMFRIGIALQPVATALFANSPFVEGAPSGFLSYRSHIWTDTDPDRCGMLPFVFDPAFGFERYVDYALNVPMYFVKRDGRYIDVAGHSFRDFLAGRLVGFEGQVPRLRDWEDHLTTVFPEVRLKRYLEMRGADSGPWDRLCALPAFWVGLLYDAEARRRALDLIGDWSEEDRRGLRDAVPRQALGTPFRGRPLRDLATTVLTIAEDGLAQRNCQDGVGLDERKFLRPLWRIVEGRRTLAEELLDRFKNEWDGHVDPVFDAYAF